MGKKRDYVMSPTELRVLRQELNDTRSVLKTAENYGGGTRASEMLDKNALRRNIKKFDELIQKHSPKPVRGAAKDRMAKKAAELSKFIQEGMPTRAEMNDMKEHPGAPTKNLKWEKDKAKDIVEWKQCQRTLEPGDPTASTV